jgi:hypothetical protein
MRFGCAEHHELALKEASCDAGYALQGSCASSGADRHPSTFIACRYWTTNGSPNGTLSTAVIHWASKHKTDPRIDATLLA